MKSYNKLLTGFVGASLVLGIAGCSDDDAPPPPAEPTVYEIMEPLDPQFATIVINDPNGTPTVTVTLPAADIELTGTATIPGAGQIDLALTATNNTPRILTNLKAVITDPDGAGAKTAISADVGADPTVLSSSGTWDTKDYTYFGPAIGAGDSADSGADGNTLVLTGIDAGASSVTVYVAMPTDHPLIVMSRWTGETGEFWLVDSATGEGTLVDSSAVSLNMWGGGLRKGAGSRDGTMLYTGSRSTGDIIVTDLTTFNDPAVDPDISSVKVSDTEPAHVWSVTMSDDGNTLYALVNEGKHSPNDPANWYFYSNETWTRLVKIDRETMEVLGSVEMLRNNAMAHAYDLDIADDGVTAVVVNASDAGSQLDIIDLDSMTVTKTIPVILENYSLQRLRSAAISPDGSTVYALYRDFVNNDADMIIADVESGDVQREVIGAGISTPHELEIGPDGMLYGSSDIGLMKVNPTTKLVTMLNTDGNEVNVVAFDVQGETLFTHTRGLNPPRGYAYDLATGTQLDTDGDTTDGTVSYLSFPAMNGSYGHLFIVTTY